MTEYRVTLDAYSGPLDLLLYLIRREEVDIYDIPIANITRQYVEYIELLKEIDPEHVGEFLVLAATLMEIKSRMLLPKPPVEEEEGEPFDPRRELVHQLLEYKRYKDAALVLESSAEVRAAQHGRPPSAPPKAADEIEMEQVDIWDLVDAFRRILEQVGKGEPIHKVGIDDTPIALHAADILDALAGAGGALKFDEIFLGRSKPELIGLFLALLELIRRGAVRASQDAPFGTIWLHRLEPAGEDGSGEEWDGLEPKAWPQTNADGDGKVHSKLAAQVGSVLEPLPDFSSVKPEQTTSVEKTDAQDDEPNAADASAAETPITREKRHVHPQAP